jgi:hypothetical protein
MIECKASRGDFLSDGKKIFRKSPHMGMGDFRFYLCPKGLILPEDLPEKWGLVWVSKGKATQKIGPKGNTQWNSRSQFFHERKNWRAEMAMMQSALRRIHIRGLLHRIYEPAPPRNLA